MNSIYIYLRFEKIALLAGRAALVAYAITTLLHATGGVVA